MVEGLLELHATDFPVPGHMGNTIGRPMPVLGRWKLQVLEKLPQLAHGSQTCIAHYHLFHL